MRPSNYDAGRWVLRGRALIAEDEFLLAMHVEDMLVKIGFEVTEIASSVETATAAASWSTIDVAVLDVSLGGVSSRPVAEALAARKIPFVLATGYRTEELDGDFRNVPTLRKPFQQEELRRCLLRAIHGA